jgi:hypothetical protein
MNIKVGKCQKQTLLKLYKATAVTVLLYCIRMLDVNNRTNEKNKNNTIIWSEWSERTERWAINLMKVIGKNWGK